MTIAASGDSVRTATSAVSSVSTAPMTAIRVRKQRRLPVNVPALVLVLAGAVLQTIAFARATWLTSATGHLGFTGLRDWAQPGYAHDFVAWIAWVLLGVTTLFGVIACIRWNGASIFRYTGAVIAIVGALMTLGAVLLIAYQTDDPSFHVARNYAVGIYLAVLGLLASALGAAAGTGRRG
jgi:hypothetical protein